MTADLVKSVSIDNLLNQRAAVLERLASVGAHYPAGGMRLSTSRAFLENQIGVRPGVVVREEISVQRHPFEV